MLKSGQIKGRALHSTLDFIRKAPVELTIERLEGAALAEALANARLNVGGELTEEQVEKLIDDLKSDDRAKQTEAGNRLASVDLDKFAKLLVPVMRAHLDSTDQNLRNLARRVAARTATVEDVPLLLGMLKGEDTGAHHEYLQALRRLKDKRAMEPLAQMIARGVNHAYAAAEALGEYGPASEDLALDLLKEKHIETKRQACRILQNAGTAKSQEALQAVITNGDPEILSEATEALRAIRLRGEEAAKLIF
jgi:HEAT repeat protein